MSLPYRVAWTNTTQLSEYETIATEGCTTEDTSLIGTQLQVPTPLKPVHTTL